MSQFHKSQNVENVHLAIQQIYGSLCLRQYVIDLLIKCFTWFNLFNPHNNLASYCSYAHFINEETEVVRLSNFPKTTELVKLSSQDLRPASMTPNPMCVISGSKCF